MRSCELHKVDPSVAQIQGYPEAMWCQYLRDCQKVHDYVATDRHVREDLVYHLEVD